MTVRYTDGARLSALIDLVHQGAGDPRRWQGILGEIAHWLQAAGGQLHAPGPDGQEAFATSGCQCMPSARTAWESLQTGLPPPGEVAIETLEVEGRPTLVGLACVLADQEAVLVLSSFCRARGAQPFGESERERFRLLMPHFGRAMVFSHTLQRERARRDSSCAALDHIGQAILLLSPSAELLHANAAAARFFGPGECFLLVRREGVAGDVLACSDVLAQRALDNALAEPAGSAPAAFRWRRPGTDAPLLLRFFRAGRGLMVMASASEAGTLPEPSALTMLFGLSPAEAKVASAYIDHDCPDAIARSLDISRNTVKVHLRQVFAKTGISCRTGLVKLLLPLCA